MIKPGQLHSFWPYCALNAIASLHCYVTNYDDMHARARLIILPAAYFADIAKFVHHFSSWLYSDSDVPAWKHLKSVSLSYNSNENLRAKPCSPECYTRKLLQTLPLTMVGIALGEHVKPRLCYHSKTYR